MKGKLWLLGVSAAVAAVGPLACGDEGNALDKRTESGGSAGQAGTTSNGGSNGGGSAGAMATGGMAGNSTGGDAGAATGGAGAGGSGMGKPCADQTCAASEACVASRTIGGAITFVGDGGMCPGGTHAEGQICMANFAYRCVAQPGCAAGELNCTCGTCPPGFIGCGAPAMSQWLDADAELVCLQYAP